MSEKQKSLKRRPSLGYQKNLMRAIEKAEKHDRKKDRRRKILLLSGLVPISALFIFAVLFGTWLLILISLISAFSYFIFILLKGSSLQKRIVKRVMKEGASKKDLILVLSSYGMDERRMKGYIDLFDVMEKKEKKKKEKEEKKKDEKMKIEKYRRSAINMRKKAEENGKTGNNTSKH